MVSLLAEIRLNEKLGTQRTLFKNIELEILIMPLCVIGTAVPIRNLTVLEVGEVIVVNKAK